MYQSRPLFLLIALLTACGEDLAPLEEPPCQIRGTLTPGATRTGYLGEASCPFGSDAIPGLLTNRDRWALQLHPDTMYIIRARYLGSAPTTYWSGRLLGYAPDEGDTLLVTGYWGSGGTVAGDRIQEMLLATTVDRPMIVHLERATPADSGSYRLEAQRCSITPLNPGVTSDTLPLDDACVLWSTGTPGRARFFAYRGDSGVAREVTVTQTGGEVPIHYAWAAKPPFNFACWYAGGSCDLGSGGKGTFTLRPLAVDGMTAGIIFTTGSRTSVQLRVDVTP
jgi:hypothetical protein